MRVIGISGRARDAAAAIAVDGSVVAAVAEESVARVEGVGYAHTSGLPFGAVRAALVHAGLSPADVDLVVVEGSVAGEVETTSARWATNAADAWLQPLAGRPHQPIDSLTARAAQAMPAVGRAHARIAVLDLEGAGHAGIFRADDGQLTKVNAIHGANGLVNVVAQVGRALGAQDGALDWLRGVATNGKPDYLAALRLSLGYDGHAIDVDAAALGAVLEQASADAPGALSNPAPIHVRVRDVRAALAASLIARLAELAGDIAAHAGNGEQVIASGSLFTSPEIVQAVQARVGALRVAPAPGPFGLALGAALAGSGDVTASLPSGLAIGPSFTEQDVKEVLDGCRLDYVYEPDWPRIHARISRMLLRGKLVAWFQGPMDFGSQSLGGRSILCDASNRYARENINRYLRHRPDDQPPPLVMLAGRTAECLTERVSSPLGLSGAKVKNDWRLRLQAGVDAAGSCRVHTVEAGAGVLGDLLAVHDAQTGCPALLHVDLRGVGEPTACSPRDAIRTTFSSPVDALVIERFLLMKDYWLLRSATEMSA
jgi:carbamoyltransferase